MRIGGFLPLSLCDFPGKIASVVFAQGCNFKCPYCHNPDLIPASALSGSVVPESRVFDFLESRRGKIDGVVFSGGEPTLQSDLAAVARRVKSVGLETMVETNGSRPEMLRTLIGTSSVDFIAMDIKAPLAIYDRLAGVPVRTAAIEESITMIAGSGIPHEFRTTLVPDVLPTQEQQAIVSMVPAGSPHRFQPYREQRTSGPPMRKTSEATVVD